MSVRVRDDVNDHLTLWSDPVTALSKSGCNRMAVRHIRTILDLLQIFAVNNIVHYFLRSSIGILVKKRPNFRYQLIYYLRQLFTN